MKKTKNDDVEILSKEDLNQGFTDSNLEKKRYFYKIEIYTEPRRLFRRRKTAKVAYSTPSKEVRLRGAKFIDYRPDGKMVIVTAVKAIWPLGYRVVSLFEEENDISVIDISDPELGEKKL